MTSTAEGGVLAGIPMPSVYSTPFPPPLSHIDGSGAEADSKALRPKGAGGLYGLTLTLGSKDTFAAGTGTDAARFKEAALRVVEGLLLRTTVACTGEGDRWPRALEDERCDAAG